jgi:hypothetical protein
LYPLDAAEEAKERADAKEHDGEFHPWFMQRRIEWDEEEFVRKPRAALDASRRATVPNFSDVEEPSERAMNADATWEATCVCCTCRARRRHARAVTTPEPTKTIDEMSVACDVYFTAIDAVWKIACDAHDVAKDSVARDHWYRPNRILMYSEPEDLHDEVREETGCDEIKYTREYTIRCCEHFVGMFMMMSVFEFEGANHVEERMCWTTEEWDEARVKAYAKEFAEITKRFADSGFSTFETLVADAINRVVEDVTNDNVDWWADEKRSKKAKK